MRTTVTLDADVAQALRELMARDGVSFKQALNDAVRRGIIPRADYAYVTPTFDLDAKFHEPQLKELLDELDAEDYLATQARIAAQIAVERGAEAAG